jgi:hypothetical protein
MTTITHDKPLTVRQEAMIKAIDSGVTALRDLAEIADYSSISVVRYNLELLAERGLVALESFDNSDRLRAFSGVEFCTAWDAAARLAGNPQA